MNHMRGICLLLLILLTACGRAEPTGNSSPAATLQSSPTTDATSQAYPLPGEPSPTPLAPVALPACTFPSLNTALAAPSQGAVLNALRFSEPSVVITSTALNLADWLPSGEQIVITRRQDARQSIELLDRRSNTIQPLTDRTELGARPVWMAASQQVVFADQDEQGQLVLQAYDLQRQGKTDVPVPLTTPYLAVSADGQQFVAFPTAEAGRPSVFAPAAASAPQRFEYRPLVPTSVFTTLGDNQAQAYDAIPLRASWHPAGTAVAIYDEHGFALVDAASGSVCSIDLGSSTDPERAEPWWVFTLRWSPDGRWLALRLATGTTLPIQQMQDVLFDLQTGVMRPLKTDADALQEVAWSPDSRYLLALGRVGHAEASRVPFLGLFLIDIASGTSQRILPAHQYILGGGYLFEGGRLAWSPDGKTVLFQCVDEPKADALVAVEGICASQVEVQE